MLVFITSLRHPSNASSWEHVLALLDRTLKSVCNQTEPDFKVIVVHNEGSELRFQHPKVIYQPIDLPPNPYYEQGALTEEGRNAFRRDRGKKYLAGLYRAREFYKPEEPFYVMFFDADDCVSSHLTRFVSSLPPKNGWFFDQGFLYRENSRFMYHLPANFSKVCGTCHIIRYDLFDLPLHPEEVEEDFVLRALGSHIFIREMLAEKGAPLEPLPFPGAVYVLHGDNHNRAHFGYRTLIDGYDGGSRGLRIFHTLSRFRYLTTSLRREFSLYPLQVASR